MKAKLIVVALLFLPMASAASAPIVSNLDNAFGGNAGFGVRPDPFGGVGPETLRRAQSFTTGSGSIEFGAVTLSMNDAPGGDGFHVDLHVDVAGVPSETPLMSLVGNGNPSITGLYDYFRSFPIVLLPNSTYWIVAAADSVPPEENFAWHATQDGSEVGEPGWSLGNGFLTRTVNSRSNLGWIGGGSGALKMAVLEIPEPSSIVAALATILLGAPMHCRRRVASAAKL